MSVSLLRKLLNFLQYGEKVARINNAHFFNRSEPKIFSMIIIFINYTYCKVYPVHCTEYVLHIGEKNIHRLIGQIYISHGLWRCSKIVKESIQFDTGIPFQPYKLQIFSSMITVCTMYM